MPIRITFLLSLFHHLFMIFNKKVTGHYPWCVAEGVVARLTDLLCHCAAGRDAYLTNSWPDASCRAFMSHVTENSAEVITEF